MELCGPFTLSQYCRRKPSKALPEVEAFSLFHPVLQAVSYLHSLNLCHRDLKMTNILITTQGNVKLIDLGFAEYTSAGPLTSYCGTPAYMSPEIVEKKEYRGKEVDLWALGVILYKLLTGEYPFGCEDDPSLQERILQANPLYPASMSEGAKKLLRGCFKVDPRARPSSAAILGCEWIIGKGK